MQVLFKMQRGDQRIAAIVAWTGNNQDGITGFANKLCCQRGNCQPGFAHQSVMARSLLKRANFLR